MSVFIPLLLTHFLADYPFQSGSIIKLKQQNYFGVLLHCLIHLTVMLFLMQGFLYEPRMLWGILIVFVTHNLIDQLKVTLDKKYPRWRFVFYCLDQMAHIMVVIGVSLWVGQISPVGPLTSLYASRWMMSYFLFLVLSTYFYDVTHYFLKHRQPDGTHYERDYKGMIKHAVIITLVFAGVYALRMMG